MAVLDIDLKFEKNDTDFPPSSVEVLWEVGVKWWKGYLLEFIFQNDRYIDTSIVYWN